MVGVTEEIRKICDNIDQLEQNQKNIKKEELKKKKNELVKELHKAMDKMKDQFLNDIKHKGFEKINVGELIASAEAMGRYLSFEIKINKIRRFLDGLRRIEVSKEYDPQSILLLRPQLAYAVGRCDKEEREFMRRFHEFLDNILIAVSESKDKNIFAKGLKFMESIIAYHRYYGGEN